ncbi:MAG: trimethylamine methyltransferase family protein [Zestosphaera sp.]
MPRPTLTILSKEEALEIHDRALDLLSRVGVKFEDPEVTQTLLEAGATKSDGRILIPEEVVNEALKNTPKKIDLYDRDGKKVATLGDGALIFNPGSAAIRILDYGTTEPRTPTLEDLRNLVVVVENLDFIDAQSTALVPGDAPIEIRDAVRLYPILKYSRKPVITGAFTVENMPVMLEMLKVVREDAWRRPFTVFDACPSPPLSWSRVTSRNIVDLARAGVPAEIVSMPGLGATAPVTVAGATALHHAEVLSGIVLAQSVSRSAPVIYGGSPTLIHPRFGTTLIVAPESILVSLAYRDLAKLLGLPTHTYMGLSDSKLVDYQSGAEEAYSALIAALAGFDVISGPGMLEFESVQSLEKLVLDNEVCGLVKRIWRGFEISIDEIATEVIEETVLRKGGNFLLHPHTRRYLRRDVHIPSLWDSKPRSRWGGRSIYDEAHATVMKLLKEGTYNELSSDVMNELNKVYAELWVRAGSKPKYV